MHRLKDLSNSEGAFFVFGDLAATVTGKARLHFSLFEVKPAEGLNVLHKTIISEPMDVQSARDWEGTKESTMLSRSFSEQGVKLRLRKESRAAGFVFCGTCVQPNLQLTCMCSRRSIIPQASHMTPLHNAAHGPSSLRPTLPPMQHLQGGYEDDGTSNERDTKRMKTYSNAPLTPGSTASTSTSSVASYQPQHYGHMQSQAYYAASPQSYNMAYSTQGYPPTYTGPQPYPYAQNYSRAAMPGYAPQPQGTPPQQQQAYQQPPPQAASNQHQSPPGAGAQQAQAASAGYPTPANVSQAQSQSGYPAAGSYQRNPYPSY